MERWYNGLSVRRQTNLGEKVKKPCEFRNFMPCDISDFLCVCSYLWRVIKKKKKKKKKEKKNRQKQTKVSVLLENVLRL